MKTRLTHPALGVMQTILQIRRVTVAVAVIPEAIPVEAVTAALEMVEILALLPVAMMIVIYQKVEPFLLEVSDYHSNLIVFMVDFFTIHGSSFAADAAKALVYDRAHIQIFESSLLQGNLCILLLNCRNSGRTSFSIAEIQ